MPHLVIEQPGLSPLRVPLSGEEVSLGRAEDNSVVLVADEVSRHHAKLCRRGEKMVVVDLNSLNGTYVNRQPIVERTLGHRDEIWLGSKCRAVFYEDEEAGPAQQIPSLRPPSILAKNLDQIREDMDRLGEAMTLIAKQERPTGAIEKPIGESPREDLVAMSRAYRRLSALYKASTQVSRLIASNADLPTRLAAVLDAAIEVTDADRGFVMLRDSTGALRVHVAREMGQELKAGSPSMGIAGHAASYGEPVLTQNPEMDPRFVGRESIVAQRIRSAMCVPLQIEERVLGSVYVDTRDPAHTFGEEDLELFASIAAQSALAIENVRLYEQMVEAEKKRASLGRFLSPAIVEAIMHEAEELELGGRKQVVTTMFCDIRGFTPIAERLAPGELVDLLNEHFTCMVKIIFGLQGTLDKYIGDEIMAVFGAPLSQDDDAYRAVKAALLMRQKNSELNLKRAREGMPEFEMGIGMVSGEAIAGYMGAPERMEFTVVGDKVNTARRLCSIAEPGQVVAGESTYERVKEFVEAKPLGTVILKGKEKPVRAYEIVRLRE